MCRKWFSNKKTCAKKMIELTWLHTCFLASKVTFSLIYVIVPQFTSNLLSLHEKLDLHKFTRCKYGAKKRKRGEIKSKDGNYRICLPVYMGL